MQRRFAVHCRIHFICLSTLVVAVALSPSRAYAGPPSQLFGKSISIHWAEDQDQKLVTGEAKHVVIEQNIGIYVSSNGRVFSRGSRAAINSRGRMSRFSNFAAARSRDPEGGVIKTSNVRYKGNVQWQGRTLLGTMPFESGARRWTVAFDEGFRTCTVDVVYGKEAGMPGVVVHGMDTRLRVIESAKIASQTCSIADGNLFGGSE